MKQTAKIREWKEKIKSEEELMTDLITNLDVKKEAELPEEEQAANKQKFKDTLAIHRATIKGFKEELRLIRLNKTGSTFFEWHPHKGMNRQQARRFRSGVARGDIKPKK